MLEEAWKTITELLTPERTEALLRAALILLIGSLVSRYGSRWLVKLIGSRSEDPQQLALIRKLLAWGFFLLTLAWALQQLGFQLGVLLGAAGVLTVAIGFASQTTLSNLISGFFLFGERPFRVGDLIEVEGVMGEVLSVDLMATKLRTLNNHYVRIPNELMIKTKVSNLTRFPLRRVDLSIPVAYNEDFARVKAILYEAADSNPHCLADPTPLFFVTDFGNESLRVQFSAWTKTSNYITTKSLLSQSIKEAFDRHQVRMPYPHRIVHESHPQMPAQP